MILEVKWSPQGTHLAAACKDGSVDILAADDLSLAGSCKGHIAAVLHVDWSADGSKLQTNSGARAPLGCACALHCVPPPPGCIAAAPRCLH